ncbi:MAG: hypothetical protein H7122_03045 [Chitinophagaceae bacterium]|nr:hypothetical protein [Chitinophagaceae bacterium]
MRGISFLAIVISLSTFSLSAQDKQQPVKSKGNCSCGFQSLLQVGLLEGASGPSWSLQTVNGIYYKSWFAGIGGGLDYYTMRTIPLFLDVRKELFRKTRTPFLYADAGIHFDWLKAKEKPGWGKSEYDRGFYYDAGFGYKLGFANRDAILLSLGYTMKRLREERVVTIQCTQPPCDPSTDYYKYKFSRLSLKIGWQFR